MIKKHTFKWIHTQNRSEKTFSFNLQKLESEKISNDPELIQSDPHPALKTNTLSIWCKGYMDQETLLYLLDIPRIL